MGRGLLALAIVFLVVVLVVAISMPREPLGTGILPYIVGNRLTEEYVPPQVIASSRTTLKPGTVWEITDSPNGVKITQKNSKLIEKIQLANVSLAAGDVIAPHLYDYYITAYNDYVEYNKPVTVNTSAAPWGWTIATSFKVYSYATDRDAGQSNAFHMVAAWRDHWGGGITFLTDIDLGYMKKITPWITNNGMNFGDNDYSGWIHVVASRITDNPNQTRGTAMINGVYCHEIVTTATDGRFAYAARVRPRVGETIVWHYADWSGRIAYAIFYTDYYLTNKTYNIVRRHVVNVKPYLFADPTWYNGTNFFGIDGTMGVPYGNVKRIPAERAWLWLVKDLEDDGKLHVRWVPPGSILKIYYNGKTYEWRINGTINQAGLIEDYTIDLASVFGATTLPNATVELVYPSQKVRVYGPPGFTLRLVGEGWNETANIPSNGSYVDFAVPSGSYTVELLGYVVQPGVSVEPAGGKVRIIVTDEDRVALPGAKVYVYDASGELVFAGVTDSIGMVELNKTAVKGDQARIVVSYLKAGKYYHVDQVVSLESNYHIEPVTPTPAPSENLAAVERAQSGGGSSALIVLLIVLLAVAAAVLLRGR